MLLGAVVSYRFFQKDVKALAQLVHGDVAKHIVEKDKERQERRAKKRRLKHRKLKIRFHRDTVNGATSSKEEAYHQKRT